MKDTIDIIKTCISENEISMAVQKLRSVLAIANSELVNDVVMISARFAKLKSEKRRGIISSSDENLRHNQIVNDLLELTEDLLDNPEIIRDYNKTEEALNKAVMEKGNTGLSAEVKSALFERIAYVKEKGIDFSAIWIADSPGSNAYEIRQLNDIGLAIDLAETSADAEALITANDYDLIISDIQRDGSDTEGLAFHKKLIRRGIDIPTIFYIGNLKKEKGVPPYAFGIANMPNELFHLVLDVIERKY